MAGYSYFGGANPGVSIGNIPQVDSFFGKTISSKEPTIKENYFSLIAEFKEDCSALKEFGLEEKQVIIFGIPYNHEHQCLSIDKERELFRIDQRLAGTVLLGDLNKITSIAICNNFNPNIQSRQKKIKLIKNSVLALIDGKVELLLEEREQYLATKVKEAISKLSGRKCDCLKLCEISLSGPQGMEYKHIAWVCEISKGNKYYCLLDNGYIFKGNLEEKEVKSEKFASTLVRYKLNFSVISEL